jgi:polyhydroxybutyrate depolymerase
VPPGYDATKPTPVVLDFHGLSMNAGSENLLSRMNAKADKAGFIAVHAEGVGAQQSWNAGVCCGEAASTKIDDVAFVKTMLDELEAKLCVDSHRIFSTGMSNGGALSHRLACELSSRIAAIAPVAHVLTIPAATCKPSRPVSVLSFNGTADTLVPYGGNGAGYPSVAGTMSGWAARDGCGTTPRQISKKGDVTCVTYDGCKSGADVSLCTVQDGGHTWPGGAPVPVLGKTTNEISATDAMWDFFVKHPLP